MMVILGHLEHLGLLIIYLVLFMEITLFYTSLITIFAIFLAFRNGLIRGKTKTMLGDGGSSELLQSIRAHGNLMEHAPIALLLLLLLEMQGIFHLGHLMLQI